MKSKDNHDNHREGQHKTGQTSQETCVLLFQDRCVMGNPTLREKSATSIVKSSPAYLFFSPTCSDV